MAIVNSPDSTDGTATAESIPLLPPLLPMFTGLTLLHTQDRPRRTPRARERARVNPSLRRLLFAKPDIGVI